MKNIKLAIFLIWGLSNISCNFSSTNISQGTVKPNIVKAIIVDHVPNTHNAGRLIVTNNEDLEAIGNEIKLVKEIGAKTSFITKVINMALEDRNQTSTAKFT